MTITRLVTSGTGVSLVFTETMREAIIPFSAIRSNGLAMLKVGNGGTRGW